MFEYNPDHFPPRGPEDIRKFVGGMVTEGSNIRVDESEQPTTPMGGSES